MTRLGRNAIRRSEKEARRRNREEKRGRRVAAGVAALATVAAVGAGQIMADAPARADSSTIDWLVEYLGDEEGISLDPAANLGTILGEIVNSPAGQSLAQQWRIQACATGGTSSGGNADCASSTGTGIAVVLPGSLEVVPVSVYSGAQSVVNSAFVQWLLDDVLGIVFVVPAAPTTEGSATVIGSGFQFALAYRNGEATAISYLPLSLATAGASDGKKAYSFALIGMANAWNTEDLPITVLGLDTGLDIPGIKHVSCYGGVTGAYAEGVGACANVLGTLDFRWDGINRGCQMVCVSPVLISERKIYEHGVRRQAAGPRRRAVA